MGEGEVRKLILVLLSRNYILMEEKNVELTFTNRPLNFYNCGVKDCKWAHFYWSCKNKESELINLNSKMRIILLAHH